MKAKQPVLVIGSAHLDMLAEYGTETENNIDKIGNLIIALGGSAYNIAVNLADNNIPVEFVTVLKKDSFSYKLIQESLTQKQISDKYIILGDNGLPESGFVAHRQNGKLKSAVSSTTIEKARISDTLLKDAISSARCIVIDCNLSAGQISQIIQISCKFGKEIFVCSVSESKIERAIKTNDEIDYKLFSMNSLEVKKFEEYKNINSWGKWDKDEIIKFCEFFKSETVVVTSGQNGYSVFNLSGWKKDFKPHTVVTPKSELGAGDALLAGIIAYYYENGNLDWKGIEGTIERYTIPVLNSIGATPNADHTSTNYDYSISVKESVFGTPRKIGKKNIDVFILMPFKEPFFSVKDSIKKAFNDINLNCDTAEDIFSNNEIIKDIWSCIFYSKLIIADCTDKNPNVFYEIGIAHTLNKPTILLAQKIEDIPFDLRHLRVLLYDFSVRGVEKLKDDLIEIVKTIEQALPTTSGLASVGVSVRGHFSDNLEAHRPSQP